MAWAFHSYSKPLQSNVQRLVSFWVQVLAAAHRALSGRGLRGDARAEKALVTLLTLPLTKYDVPTSLGLCEWLVCIHGRYVLLILMASQLAYRAHWTWRFSQGSTCMAIVQFHADFWVVVRLFLRMLGLCDWSFSEHAVVPPSAKLTWLLCTLPAEYPLLMGLLRLRTRKELATRICNIVLDSRTHIASLDKADMLFRWEEAGGHKDDVAEVDWQAAYVGMQVYWILADVTFKVDASCFVAIFIRASLSGCQLCHGWWWMMI
jgi:hypothetical protein